MLSPTTSNRVAVLIDCDNVCHDIASFAIQAMGGHGKISVRRGYGNKNTLSSKWQDTLIKQGFTPCLQYQWISGKNTTDTALAIDAMELWADQRIEVFCIVTSDSDFSYLCRKLIERGAEVYVVGASKTPEALRSSCDQFFEWQAPDFPSNDTVDTNQIAPSVEATPQPVSKPSQAVSSPSELGNKKRPRFLIDAVAQLAAQEPSGHVNVGSLGSHLKTIDPTFSPKKYGHSKLISMIKTYDQLVAKQDKNKAWLVSVVKPIVGNKFSKAS